MKTCLISEQIGTLIRKDELLSAIKLVNQALEGSPLLDEAIIHSRVYSDLAKKIRSGQISLEDESITKNKISYALMELAREIEMQYSENPKIRSQVDKVYGTVKDPENRKINQIHHGSGDNVGGDKIIRN